MSRKKIVACGDIILAPSGVGTQLRYIVEHLDKTGKYDIIHLGGAMKHKSHQPIKVAELPNTIIIPVDGYGSPDLMRQVLDFEKPDCFLLITDPRYYQWFFEMEDEIHQMASIVYWNIWDNADEITWPKYNKHFYDACDKLPAINKLTYKFLSENGWKDKASYVPHGVPKEDFFIIDDPKEIKKLKTTHLGGKEKEDAFIVFYNSRNALRKRTGTCIMAFKEFLDGLPVSERNYCTFCMKTPPNDSEGQPLFTLIKDFGLEGKIAIADQNYPPNVMNEFYNIADVTISMSSEEGFGLSVLESLMVGTPVICTKTGGMQDQVLDLETGEEFGFCLEPEARSLIGSLSTPYIYSDHISIKTVAAKIREIYEEKKKTGKHKEKWASLRARENMLRRFSIDDMRTKMESIVDESIKQKDERLNNKKIRLIAL